MGTASDDPETFRPEKRTGNKKGCSSRNAGSLCRGWRGIFCERPVTPHSRAGHHEPGHSASDPRAQAPSDLRTASFALAIVLGIPLNCLCTPPYQTAAWAGMYSKNTSRDGRGGVSSSSALSAADSSLKSSSIIALICATSWTLLACAIRSLPCTSYPGTQGRLIGSTDVLTWRPCRNSGMVPVSLQIHFNGDNRTFSPGIIGAIHPILPGVAASFISFAMFAKRESG